MSSHAFPTIYNVESNENWQTEEGMSLLDWFAGQYLIGMSNPSVRLSPQEIADECYIQAQAMMARRAK